MVTQNHLKQSDLGKLLDLSVHLLVSYATYFVRVPRLPKWSFFLKKFFFLYNNHLVNPLFNIAVAQQRGLRNRQAES
jgi:hypothetical protein